MVGSSASKIIAAASLTRYIIGWGEFMKQGNSKNFRDRVVSTQRYIFFFGFAVFSILHDPIFAQESTRQAKLQQMLERITNGKSPCFTDSCQKEKNRLLLKIQSQSSRLPSYFYDQDTPASSSISSAFRLVRSKFEPLERPQSLPDWYQWWKRRNSHDLALKSDWMGFKGQLSFYRYALYTFLKFSQQPEFFKEDFQRIWGSGGGQIASHLIELSKISDRILNSDTNERTEQVQRLKQKQKKLQEQLRGFDDQTEDELAFVLEDSFPQLARGERFLLLHFLNRATKQLMIQDPLDPSFLSSLRYFYKSSTQIYQNAQDFEDLEYGVLGLANFESTTNPVVDAEEKIAIYKTISQVDGAAREIIDISSYILFFLAADKATSGSHLLSMMMAGTHDFILLKNDELRFSDHLFQASNRLHHLENQRAHFGLEMEARKKLLENEKNYLEQELLKIKETRMDSTSLERNLP